MTINVDTITSVASVISALAVILGLIYAIINWYTKQAKQDTDILTINIKEEQSLLTKGVLACLKGLREQGCDGPVDEAIKALEEYINTQAHK